jgi:hypothetical protein
MWSIAVPSHAFVDPAMRDAPARRLSDGGGQRPQPRASIVQEETRVVAIRTYMKLAPRRRSMCEITRGSAQSNADFMANLKVYYNTSEEVDTHAYTHKQKDKQLFMREALRFDPIVVTKLNRLWNLVDVDNSASIDIQEYTSMFFLIFYVLHGRVACADDDVPAVARKEFSRDVCGKDSLDKLHFKQAFFQLTDTWTDQVSTANYSSFLDSVLAIFTVRNALKFHITCKRWQTVVKNTREARRLEIRAAKIQAQNDLFVTILTQTARAMLELDISVTKLKTRLDATARGVVKAKQFCHVLLDLLQVQVSECDAKQVFAIVRNGGPIDDIVTNPPTASVNAFCGAVTDALMQELSKPPSAHGNGGWMRAEDALELVRLNLPDTDGRLIGTQTERHDLRSASRADPDCRLDFCPFCRMFHIGGGSMCPQNQPPQQRGSVTNSGWASAPLPSSSPSPAPFAARPHSSAAAAPGVRQTTHTAPGQPQASLASAGVQIQTPHLGGPGYPPAAPARVAESVAKDPCAGKWADGRWDPVSGTHFGGNVTPTARASAPAAPAPPPAVTRAIQKPPVVDNRGGAAVSAHPPRHGAPRANHRMPNRPRTAGTRMVGAHLHRARLTRGDQARDRPANVNTRRTSAGGRTRSGSARAKRSGVEKSSACAAPPAFPYSAAGVPNTTKGTLGSNPGYANAGHELNADHPWQVSRRAGEGGGGHSHHVHNKPGVLQRVTPAAQRQYKNQHHSRDPRANHHAMAPHTTANAAPAQPAVHQDKAPTQYPVERWNGRSCLSARVADTGSGSAQKAIAVRLPLTARRQVPSVAV